IPLVPLQSSNLSAQPCRALGTTEDLERGANRPSRRILAERLETTAGRFEFDSQQPVEMNLLLREPVFEFFASRGFEFDEHLPFLHIDEDASCPSLLAVMKPACEFLCTLTGEAGERVLRDVARHLISCF